MADMPTDFWSGWIILITVISMAGMSWLVYSVFFSANGHEEESPVWDENLTKEFNPAPMWWFWFIFACLIFSVIYLMLYPGLGSYSGVLNWSQGGRLDESYATYHDQFGDLRALVRDASVDTLRDNQAAMRSAQRVFEQNCAACHGPDAKGQAALFPDLRDAHWQWGGSETAIEQTIRFGRNAVMPGWQAVLGDDGVKQVTDYLLAWNEKPDGDSGKTLYTQFCIACHGADGNGVAALGGPSLIDDVWLYGGDAQSIEHSIGIGRTGIMPAFDDRLDDTQIKMLTAWLSQ